MTEKKIMGNKFIRILLFYIPNKKASMIFAIKWCYLPKVLFPTAATFYCILLFEKKDCVCDTFKTIIWEIIWKCKCNFVVERHTLISVQGQHSLLNHPLLIATVLQ